MSEPNQGFGIYTCRKKMAEAYRRYLGLEPSEELEESNEENYVKDAVRLLIFFFQAGTNPSNWFKNIPSEKCDEIRSLIARFSLETERKGNDLLKDDISPNRFIYINAHLAINVRKRIAEIGSFKDNKRETKLRNEWLFPAFIALIPNVPSEEYMACLVMAALMTNQYMTSCSVGLVFDIENARKIALNTYKGGAYKPSESFSILQESKYFNKTASTYSQSIYRDLAILLFDFDDKAKCMVQSLVAVTGSQVEARKLIHFVLITADNLVQSIVPVVKRYVKAAIPFELSSIKMNTELLEAEIIPEAEEIWNDFRNIPEQIIAPNYNPKSIIPDPSEFPVQIITK